jgi:hypothetical protein
MPRNRFHEAHDVQTLQLTLLDAQTRPFATVKLVLPPNTYPSSRRGWEITISWTCCCLHSEARRLQINVVVIVTVAVIV